MAHLLQKAKLYPTIARPQNALREVLSKQIQQQGGSISLAEFMKQSQGHEKYGYYMQGDVFGAQGDFITSPDISQMFGQMIGTW